LLEETREQSLQILKAYQELLGGLRSGMDVWKILRAKSQLGVTSGTLDTLPTR
jgi:putative protease